MSSRKKLIVFPPLPVVLIKTQNLLFIYLNKKIKNKKRERKFGLLILIGPYVLPGYPSFMLALGSVGINENAHTHAHTQTHTQDEKNNKTKCIMTEPLFWVPVSVSDNTAAAKHDSQRVCLTPAVNPCLPLQLFL